MKQTAPATGINVAIPGNEIFAESMNAKENSNRSAESQDNKFLELSEYLEEVQPSKDS